MRKLDIFLISVLLFLIPLILYKVFIVDGFSPMGKTVHKLGVLGEVVVEIERRDIPLDQCESFSMFMSIADKHEILDTPGWFGTDGWGRDFRYEMQRLQDGMVIRITSLGQNGVWENGEGDDLYVEVRFSGSMEPQVYIRKP